MKNKAAVICAKGLGDGLLMMIAAEAFRNKNFEVDIFHPAHDILSPLFSKEYRWLKLNINNLQSYAQIILQHDHGENAFNCMKKRNSGELNQLKIFFPKKSAEYTTKDFLFHLKHTAAWNIARSMQEILHLDSMPLDNGLIRPNGLFRKFPKRIVIHPTSADKQKNWLPNQFLQLVTQLQKMGFEPTMIVSPAEKNEWKSFCSHICPLRTFPNLQQVAAFLYESGFFIGNDSGIGHLASNVGLPTLTICGNRKIAELWRPGWSINELAMISFPLPNFKGIHFRIREWCWPIFVPVCKVLHKFEILYQRVYEQIGSSN
jgi:hypothetical protein